MKNVIAKAIAKDAPVTIVTKDGQECMGWVFERYTDEESIYISPGFSILYEDIARITVA